MNRIAIIYYSMSENTDYVAKYISNKINVDLIRIIPKKEYPSSGFKKFFWGGKSALMKELPELEEYDFDCDKYDYLVLGTPVWASTFTPPIRSFVNENKSIINNKKVAVFVCHSGGGAEKTIEKLRVFIGIDNFNAQLILVDPKDKKSEEKDKKIDDFCSEISE